MLYLKIQFCKENEMGATGRTSMKFEGISEFYDQDDFPKTVGDSFHDDDGYSSRYKFQFSWSRPECHDDSSWSIVDVIYFPYLFMPSFEDKTIVKIPLYFIGGSRKYRSLTGWLYRRFEYSWLIRLQNYDIRKKELNQKFDDMK